MNTQIQSPQAQTHIYTGQIAFVQEKGAIHYVRQDVTPKILTKQEIFKPQRNMMMDNYRHYVQQYANRCYAMNKEIIAYNKTVQSHIKETDSKDESIRRTEMLQSGLGKVSIEEYNEAAKIENKNNGRLLIELKKHVPIKKPTEAIFSMILFKYSMQINEKNAMLERCGAVTTRAIQKVKINPYELANTTINDVDTLPYTKRTIQNHINRLIDAGVLFNYTFNGSNKPVEYHVNNDILVIYDHKTQKTLTADNELFNSQGGKNFHHNEIVTRANKDKKKITEIVSKQFPLKEVLQSFVPHDNQSKKNKSTNPPIAKKDAPAAEKSAKNSEFLREMTLPSQTLIQQLTNGDHDNYRMDPNLINGLEREALHGNMNTREFRELLLQIFIKMSAPIWKGKNVYMGVWAKAYMLMDDEFLLNFNGSVPSKMNAIHFFNNLVWRLTYAKDYFRNFTEFRPLFPSDYFDPTRKLKGSGGFAYTLEALKDQMEYENAAKKRKEKRERDAVPRNKAITARRLVEKKINEVVKGNITVSQLHDYVKNNAHIPQDYIMNLPNMLAKAFKC
ncbi:hypothetical protein [Gelidibacter japonicus]|uniref:hypothetical protein n=1 Tax=Gelidibacter japonicus TaxID=1962232 RepID=UPI002AFFF4C6|nr:hypothetical protein [Gelidibacter japonicus]